MLFQVVLTLETLPTNLTAESQIGTLVRTFVNHEIVGLGEPALTVLADELTLGPHLAPELAAAVLVLDLHYGEHRGDRSLQPWLRVAYSRYRCVARTARQNSPRIGLNITHTHAGRRRPAPLQDLLL